MPRKCLEMLTASFAKLTTIRIGTSRCPRCSNWASISESHATFAYEVPNVARWNPIRCDRILVLVTVHDDLTRPQDSVFHAALHCPDGLGSISTIRVSPWLRRCSTGTTSKIANTARNLSLLRAGSSRSNWSFSAAIASDSLCSISNFVLSQARIF